MWIDEKFLVFRSYRYDPHKFDTSWIHWSTKYHSNDADPYFENENTSLKILNLSITQYDHSTFACITVNSKYTLKAQWI